jgi:selenocysteine-specific translation elongation factor
MASDFSVAWQFSQKRTIYTLRFVCFPKVVDAVEGPLEQTHESIRAVKEARVSMIVAINKIDRPEANVEATKKALYEAGVEVALLCRCCALQLSSTQGDQMSL